MRSCAMLSVALAGCLYLSTMPVAVAAPPIPIAPAHVTAAPASGLFENIYYYRGRYYRYRYGGRYYAHRVYRNGRWNYY